ncbi:MAG: hypothetical protein GC162_05940 [Planctomycetes bacterium]|nr:hypothetical protein [Planctomycetota bacterium]
MSMATPELIERIMGQLDARLDADETKALEQTLAGDVAAMALYLDLLDLHATLSWKNRQAQPSEAAMPALILEETNRGDEGFRVRGSGFRKWAVAAAMLIGATIAMAIYLLSFTPHAAHRTPHATSPVALMSNVSDDARFGARSMPVLLGSDLSPGMIALDAGEAQVMFHSGAVIDLSGRCEFDVRGVNGGELHRGLLHAFVPRSAAGFTVTTPDGVKVVDLGTEFTLLVTPDERTELKVLRGKVELVTPTGVRHRVLGGEEWTIDHAGLAAQINSATTQWRRYVERIDTDAALVAHYRFDGDAVNSTELREDHDDARLAGRIAGPTPDDGRLPGKSSLRFAGMPGNDHVELGQSAGWGATFSGSFTVAIWFKVDRFDAPYHTLIAVPDRQWRLVRMGESSKLVFNTGWPKGGDSLESKVNVDDGKWHLAVIAMEVVSETHAIKSFYIDGAAQGVHDVRPLHASDQNVWLGYNPADPKGNTFNGWIDELFVFNRILTAGEVRDLYEHTEPSFESLEKGQ